MTRAYRLGKTLVTANLQYTGIVFSSLWGMLLWGDVLTGTAGSASASFSSAASPRPITIHAARTRGSRRRSKTDPIATEI